MSVAPLLYDLTQSRGGCQRKCLNKIRNLIMICFNPIYLSVDSKQLGNLMIKDRPTRPKLLGERDRL